jgi:hypothetical protein
MSISELEGQLFHDAREMVFVDGMETEFSRRLVRVVREAPFALDVITNMIVSGSVSEEVAAESLRWLGEMRDQDTHFQRRFLLEKSLLSESPRVRDGAVSGLSYLDDPHAEAYLKDAAQRETIESLREDMLVAARELR